MVKHYQVVVDSWGANPMLERGHTFEIEDDDAAKAYPYDIDAALANGAIVEIDESGSPVEQEDGPVVSPTPVGQLPIGDEKALGHGSMAGQDQLVVPSGSADDDAEATVMDLPDESDDDEEPDPAEERANRPGMPDADSDEKPESKPKRGR